MSKDTYRVVSRGPDGKLRIRDYDRPDTLLRMHTQIGVDDCSTDLGLRGLPVFRGLIGPMPEGKNVIRYESPEVFETLTKEWGTVQKWVGGGGGRMRMRGRNKAARQKVRKQKKPRGCNPWAFCLVSNPLAGF